MQHVPGMQILITIASGVISPAAMHHPITWFRGSRSDRQRPGNYWPCPAPITFGEVPAGANHEHKLAEIEQAARHTLNQHLLEVQV